MQLISLKPYLRSTTVNINLSPPIFNWNGVAPRFFEMIYDALNPEYTVNVSDFSTVVGASLGELVAKYNILGSKSYVALSAEKLTFEFPFQAPNDYRTIVSIVEKIDSSFKEKFAQHKYRSLQIIIAEHAYIIDGTAVADYLERYKISTMEEMLHDSNIVHTPGVRFTNTDENRSWRVNCTAEASVLIDGLFLLLDLNFLDESLANDEFHKKLIRYQQITEACLLALGLEQASNE